MRSVLGSLLFCALCAAGCATGEGEATGEEPATTASATTSFATIPPPPTTKPPPTTAPPTTVGTRTQPAIQPSPTTSEPPTASLPVAQAPSASASPNAGDSGASSDIDVVGESSADEPTFDIGPQVALDVDLVRFPVDDAGQGGSVTTGAAPDSTPVVDEQTPVQDEATGWAAVDRYLETQLIRSGNTAASYAVSIGGDVVRAAAFGRRDPASGDPVESRDRFRVASISKPITAIVALSLVEDGTIGLDEPIGDRIAEHVGLEGVSAGTTNLTLRELLTHRSGFSKYQSTFFGGGADDCVDAARRGLAAGAAGGGYTYSNMNYCVVGLLVESITGQSYEQAVYSRLLTPLGISGMRLPPTVDPGPDEVQHRTTPGRNYMETLGGAGAWIASPTDLVTILDALDLETPGYKPLGREMVLQMVTPPGGGYGDRGYGLGLISYGDGRFGHTGTIESTHAMLLNRGDGVTWAITVAGDHPSESTDLERIMDRAFEAGGFVDG